MFLIKMNEFEMCVRVCKRIKYALVNLSHISSFYILSKNQIAAHSPRLTSNLQTSGFLTRRSLPRLIKRLITIN